MNRLSLIACRRILFLEVEEAATHIAGVSQRTWRYYESGRTQIPAALVVKMEALMRQHAHLKERMTKDADEHRLKGEGRQVIPYYLTFEDYQQETGLDDVIGFRLDQSVKASLYLEDKVVFY